MDGNYFNTFKYFYNDTFYIIKHECVIKGDSLHKEISGASILAKVSRDQYIENFIDEIQNMMKNMVFYQIKDMRQKFILKASNNMDIVHIIENHSN